MMPTPEIVSALVQLGRCDDTTGQAAQDALLQLTPHERVGHSPRWQRICKPLSTDELAYLVRGLTHAEKDLQWRGGSVSAVIHTYRLLEARDPEAAEEVADWVLRRTDNGWAPFGHDNRGARSLREYGEAMTALQQQKEEWESELEAEAASRAEEKTYRLGQRELAHAERDAERSSLIADLTAMTPSERFAWLAKQEKGFRLEMIPTDLLPDDVDSGLISRGDAAVLAALIDTRGGWWERLARQLRALYPDE